MVGDIVRWVGFPDADQAQQKKCSRDIGIIVAITKRKILMRTDLRVDVVWADGSFGNALYPGTIEVISEER